MKRIVGTEVGGYAFNPTAKTVAITGMPALKQEQLLVIVNTTTGGFIYNFADPSYGGTVDGNLLSFAASASGMAASDNLTIVVDIDDSKVYRAAEDGIPFVQDDRGIAVLTDILDELRQIRQGMEVLTGVEFTSGTDD